MCRSHWLRQLFPGDHRLFLLFLFQDRERFQDADEAEGALSSTVQENLTGVRVVRAFGREKYEIDRFDEKNNAYSNLWVYLGKLMSVYWASGDLITNCRCWWLW